jgi:hypothetical protein
VTHDTDLKKEQCLPLDIVGLNPHCHLLRREIRCRSSDIVSFAYNTKIPYLSLMKFYSYLSILTDSQTSVILVTILSLSYSMFISFVSRWQSRWHFRRGRRHCTTFVKSSSKSNERSSQRRHIYTCNDCNDEVLGHDASDGTYARSLLILELLKD